MDRDLRRFSAKRHFGKHVRQLAAPFLWAAAVVIAWEVAGRVLGFHPDVLPTPSRIFLEWIRESEKLRAHGIITAAEVLGAFSLSFALSIPASTALALTPSLHRSILPMISALNRAPLIAAIPLAFVWLGFGFRSILLLASLLSFLTLTLGFVRGMKSVSDNVLDLARLAHAGPIRTFTKLRLPSSLPCAFAAMKGAIPLIVGVVAIGEFVDGEKGLGYLMLAAAFKMETSLVLAALAAILLLGLMLYTVIALVELAFVRQPLG